MISVVTIPRAVFKQGDLVILPRREYEYLLRVCADVEHDTVDADIETGLRDFKMGRSFGPFESVAAFKAAVKQYEVGAFKKSPRRVSRVAARAPHPRRGEGVRNLFSACHVCA